MSAPWANLDGVRVVSARVTIPWFGAWAADVVLADASSIGEMPTLTIGTLVLEGARARASSFSGARSARLVGGRGGWRKDVGARAYRFAGGVRLATVLGDAAAEVGEAVDLDAALASATVGDAYVREAGPASRVLRQLAGPAWWTDPATGRTKVGSRVPTPITSDFSVEGYKGAEGRVVVATEALADWTPARTFTSPTLGVTLTVGGASLVVEGDGRARVEVTTS